MKEIMEAMRCMVDYRLETLLEKRTPELLWNSMAYSVRAGGKRLRPTMALMATMLKKESLVECLDLACAIEMIHTYSLIHDDLPALDNDTLRRGVATNHVVFGEAQAILAGDGLLNYAYEVMLANAARYPDNMAAHLRAIRHVAEAAGVTGMIAGQVQDVHYEGEPIGIEELSYIHSHKTGAMITGSLLAGLELADPTDEERAALSAYGQKVGLVFQIVDDILDITAGAELGKTTGKDEKSGKTTYPTLYGIEKSMEMAKQLTEEAIKDLEIFGEQGDMLAALAQMMLGRNK
ncbi:MAG: polyprenyl synthetase family protein [Christensenellaceae bacterium]|nr:polyprenyl synthetase family protein [Christensenellaceae bacterium]